jgi:urea transporter
MDKKSLKSIGAVLTGFVFVVILSIATDLLLEKTGLMKQPFDLNPWWFIVLVIFYRSLYETISTYPGQAFSFVCHFTYNNCISLCLAGRKNICR